MSDIESRAPPSPAVEKPTTIAAKSSSRQHAKNGAPTANMNGPLYMQTSGSNVVLVRRLKRKEEGTWKSIARWFVENQIGMYSLYKLPISSIKNPAKY